MKRAYDYTNVARVRDALAYLRLARTILAETNHPRAADKVRRALKSAEGALRHEHHRRNKAGDPPHSTAPARYHRHARFDL